jgi:hypothetical protein
VSEAIARMIAVVSNPYVEPFVIIAFFLIPSALMSWAAKSLGNSNPG